MTASLLLITASCGLSLKSNESSGQVHIATKTPTTKNLTNSNQPQKGSSPQLNGADTNDGISTNSSTSTDSNPSKASGTSAASSTGSSSDTSSATQQSNSNGSSQTSNGIQSTQQVEASQSLVYKNSKYGYSVVLPSDWKGHYRTVETYNPSTFCLLRVDFDYIDKGTDYGSLFSINTYTNQTWASIQDSGMEEKLLSKNGLTLSYMQAGQPTESLLNDTAELHQAENLLNEVNGSIQKSVTW